MIDFLMTMTYWHWFFFAAVLLICEVTLGSGFFLCLGIAAGCVGLLYLFLPLSSMAAWLTFALLSVVGALLWKLYLSYFPRSTTKGPILNRRGEQYIGRVFMLKEPIINGKGSLIIDDTHWQVYCTDLPSGTRIRITGTEGVILLAEPFDT